MTVKAKISTSGFDKAFEAIRKAGGNIEAAADRALLAGARVLQDGMKRRAPKDTHNLEDHINIDGPYNEGGTLIYIDVGVLHDRRYTDADTARYGNAQEYGWKSEYGTPQSNAQPYIRPTIDEDMKIASKAMRESLRRDGAI